jgi:hypothetical protein
VKSAQTQGRGERLPKTLLKEGYRIPLRKQSYPTGTEFPADLEEWGRYYHEERGHQGQRCGGHTPMRTFLDTIPLATEKL